ncbi:MAG: phytanoyl-CoA dioxygenase [Sphingobacteriales bacterium]|nr:MAG: phytanoyl-CoA dioxygenase [Sphingobacteriales bacterium]
MSTQHDLVDKGFNIVNDIYTPAEIQQIIDAIERADTSQPTFRKSADLFAVRQFLKGVPGVAGHIFTDRFKALVSAVAGDDYFLVKSIYFDKPEASNWFVAWHQDLTISVDKRMEVSGYGPWTVKQNQYAVQPPQDILDNILTIRIHLDDTNEDNGALRVLDGSHRNGIIRPEQVDKQAATETVCNVSASGVMLMKPLLMHSSGRTVNKNRRRVIHLELSNKELPKGLQWAERLTIV